MIQKNIKILLVDYQKFCITIRFNSKDITTITIISISIKSNNNKYAGVIQRLQYITPI